MTQSYFPTRSVSSPALQSAHAPSSSSDGDKPHMRAEEVQDTFLQQRNSLLDAIHCTMTLLHDLRRFNKEDWTVRYPQLSRHQVDEPESELPSGSKVARRKSVRRSLSFADDPSFQADVVVTPGRKGLTRSMTLATIPDESLELPSDDEVDRLVTSSEADDFHIFRLDLKLGSHGSSSSPASLVAQLEKASIANLVDDRISSSLSHMDKLRQRVEDTSSKVLVTGDLNAGKSTFVNALLRKDVMPVDQQPCTTAFCEVHDAAENGGLEELHILKDGYAYDVNDSTTFTRVPLSELEKFVSENENIQQMLKVYLADGRPRTHSLLNNGIVDISLIDAPGLNRDSAKTTAVFARQEEIDVVVFVVSAENHFTLSAKEFLFNASNEKAYLFIVVNKYDQIRDKAKCRRLILDQIRQLSPRTYEDAEDLVHFVDSAAAFQHDGTEAFDNLEKDLRSFVLVKRSKSKLAPVSTYITNVLSDIDILAGANCIVAQKELDEAREELNRTKPVLEKMKQGRESLDESLGNIEERGASRTISRTKEILLAGLDRVGQGKLAVDEKKVALRMPTYPGLLYLWDFVKDVKRTMLASVDLSVKLAEDEARVATTASVNELIRLEDTHLPEGVERSRRVFMPEAMFSTRASQKERRGLSKYGRPVTVAGGLGLSLAQQPDMIETTFFDICDVPHYFFIHFGNPSNGSEHKEEAALTALSVASVGLGAMTMVGGQTVGIRGLLESVFRITNLFSNESARKWAGPAIAIVGLGATAYIVWDLPNSVPRTIGRRVREALMKEHPELTESSFVDVHAVRVGRETRKVVRLASYDLRERYRAAAEETSRRVREAEAKEKQALGATTFFHKTQERAAEVREIVLPIASA
ncbi:hypothetical protein BDW22DRAFT_1405551 [Trametopsis cervina]|nr:hypothetical protein BDW22DRAFT_1405551 [Trametopsis cervina]